MGTKTTQHNLKERRKDPVKLSSDVMKLKEMALYDVYSKGRILGIILPVRDKAS